MFLEGEAKMSRLHQGISFYTEFGRIVQSSLRSIIYPSVQNSKKAASEFKSPLLSATVEPMATAELVLNPSEALDAYDAMKSLGYLDIPPIKFLAGPGLMDMGQAAIVQPGAYDVFPTTPVFMIDTNTLNGDPFDEIWQELFAPPANQSAESASKKPYNCGLCSIQWNWTHCFSL
jgi:hypothetical protein